LSYGGVTASLRSGREVPAEQVEGADHGHLPHLIASPPEVEGPRQRTER